MQCFRIILFFICVACSVNATAQQNRVQQLNNVLHPAPAVDFGWTDLCFGDTTKFYNATIRAVTYTWTISTTTGTVTTVLYTSNTKDISFLFPSKGIYDVELDADNGHFVTLTKTVTVDTFLNADFSFLWCANVFSNMSSCVSGCQWDFGDGTTSTAQIPTHQYADTGKYNIKLIVWNGMTSDTVTKQIYIAATHVGSSAFTYYQSGDTTFFHAVDHDPTMLYYWTFGDQANSTGQDTFHIYATADIYTVTLITQDGCGISIGNDTITVNPYTLGINYLSDPKNVNNVFVFPNPASTDDELHLMINSGVSENAKLSAWNIYGQKIFENECLIPLGKTEMKIKTENMEPGSYFLLIQGRRFAAKTKLVVLNKK
jgi:PKD repeat protein